MFMRSTARRAFSLVELLVSLVIISALVALVVPIATGFVQRAQEESNRRTLAALNEALDYYRTYGGDINALTEGASVGNVIGYLKNEIVSSGVPMKFLSDSVDIDVDRLYATGNGHRYRFYGYGTYNNEPSIPLPDPDAIDYFARAEALGGSFDQTAINATYTEDYVKDAIEAFIQGLKSDGVWDKLTEVYLLCGVSWDGITAKLKYLSTPTLSNSGVLEGNYVAAGIGAGPGVYSSQHFNTGFFDTSLDPDDVSVSGYLTTAVNGNPVTFVGNLNISVGRLASDHQNRRAARFFTSEIAGSWIVVRQRYRLLSCTSNTLRRYYENGIQEGSDSTNSHSNVFGGDEITIGDLERGNSCSFAHIGLGLTDTEALNLSSRVNALMVALGCNTYEADGGPLFDSDAKVYFERAEALGGSFDLTSVDPTYTELYVKRAISDFVEGCKADGIWTKISEAYLMSGVTWDGIRAKLKYSGASTLVNNGFSSSDYVPAGSAAGLTGNGSTKNLETGVQGWKGSFSAYVHSSVASNFYIANNQGGANRNYGIQKGSFQIGGSMGSIPSAQQYIVCTFDGSNPPDAYIDGLYQTTASAGSIDTNTNWSNNWTIFSFGGIKYHSGRISFAHLGSYMSATEVGYLSSRVNALMTALGCNVY